MSFVSTNPARIPESDIDRAWGAGLFEGEGCFTIASQTGHVSAVMNSTDLDVLERFQNAFGGSLSGPYQKQSGRKPQWRWSSTGYRNVSTLGLALSPWLQSRRVERLYEVLANHLERRRLKAEGLTVQPRRRRWAKRPADGES